VGAHDSLNIVFVLGSLEVGGTETQACRLARELTELGHRLTVLVIGQSGPLADRLAVDGIDFEVFGYGGIRFRRSDGKRDARVAVAEISKLRAFARRYRSLRPDVCHAFLYWSYVIALPVAAFHRTPVRVSGRRGLIPPGRHRIRHELERISNRCANVVVANSEAVARDVVAHQGDEAVEIVVIPNGVDRPAGTAEVERQPPVGLFVANLIGYKGHADLLCALSLLDDPPLIRMVGKGPERERLERMILDAGLERSAVLEGPALDARLLFGEAQFAILPSHAEGMPNAILEAMAAGLPVIATDVGGIPELIDDGVHGLLVPPRAPRALAEVIRVIAQDPELRRKLGDAARARAADFAWSRCARAHEELYARKARTDA
jgi:glycosyltransferase involved in cell wall biosynthesis